MLEFVLLLCFVHTCYTQLCPGQSLYNCGSVQATFWGPFSTQDQHYFSYCNCWPTPHYPCISRKPCFGNGTWGDRYSDLELVQRFHQCITGAAQGSDFCEGKFSLCGRGTETIDPKSYTNETWLAGDIVIMKSQRGGFSFYDLPDVPLATIVAYELAGPDKDVLNYYFQGGVCYSWSYWDWQFQQSDIMCVIRPS